MRTLEQLAQETAEKKVSYPVLLNEYLIPIILSALKEAEAPALRKIADLRAQLEKERAYRESTAQKLRSKTDLLQESMAHVVHLREQLEAAKEISNKYEDRYFVTCRRLEAAQAAARQADGKAS